MTISIVHRRGRRGNRNQTTYLIVEDELHQLKLSVGDLVSEALELGLVRRANKAYEASEER